MMIHVVYKNNHHDLVKASMLQELIDNDLILKFLRSEGCVTIGVDPIRNSVTSGSYSGPERRETDTSVPVPTRLLSTPFSSPNP